jgi:hypothetical protein
MMFFLSHSLGRSKQGRRDARAHILCNGKQQQLLMLVDLALLNSFFPDVMVLQSIPLMLNFLLV